ncbi:ABC transporter A family member 8-like isoform X2 [Euphorbia lathyris]|uniref:ABC transporter A family member 8-like isoform X2 n=1 Tax=Euphorbia lathyris TaxID=212925 RepID=UPI003313B40E
MADDTHNAASFWTQADALLRKNLTYQKRNARANCCLIFFPVFLCLLLFIAQTLVSQFTSDDNNVKCDCHCDYSKTRERCEKLCGREYSNLEIRSSCPLPSPPHWPPMLHILPSYARGVKFNAIPFTDLANDGLNDSYPVTILLFTGKNQSLGEIVARSMFTSSFALNSSDLLDSLADIALGSDTFLIGGFPEEALIGEAPLYYIQHDCSSNSNLAIAIPQFDIHSEATCIQGLNLWRNSSSEINDELYKGYQNEHGETIQILTAYDFLNSNGNTFNVSVWYYPAFTLRVPRLVNLVSNAYIQFLHGSGTKILFDFVKEMPKLATPTTQINLDFSSLLGPLFFTWVILLLFPVVLTSLVYEKQQKLRIMMKMHGLGDGPYFIISYAYFLLISLMYVIVLVIFGSLVGLKFFMLNDYSLQFVFYFIYINLQIAMAFLVAALFSHVKTASVVAYACVFGTGLLGAYVFENFVADSSSRSLVIALELYPGFSLYRGLYELSKYTLADTRMGWGNLEDKENGIQKVLYIMLAEWLVLGFVAYYMDKVSSSGSGKHPLFFLHNFGKKRLSSFQKPNLQREGSTVVDIDKPDVCLERNKVEQLLLEPNAAYTIICDNLRKMYPGDDGNPPKMAVQGLSLALSKGECLGMLGPNGAGKTSFISMMIGLTKPTLGTAYIQGLDIRTQMDWIYNSMGVCPQHDLLWESLTGREHLLFYGRLKNLKGSALKQAVEKSLKGVNLFNGGVADKQAGKYSGGMKRRLSVAISLIGDPKVVYMDEPTSGLDPASRRQLWSVVRQAKQDRTIILTTHSMEEAEALCDRVGIVVDGSLRCLESPKELKARYGGSYTLTMTTSVDEEQQVVNMVQKLSPNAEKIYNICGTQKFEMPKCEVSIADVFLAVEMAKIRFPVSAWGLSDTSLEDVFTKVANGS